MSTTGWVLLILLIILVVVLVNIFNRLVALKNQFANAFSQIDVQLKRRYDLIPNLVETAKTYMQHERETLEAVIAARNAAATGLNQAEATNAADMNQLNRAESKLATAMGRFNVVVEQYPDLKADTQMLQLTEELSSTENKVAFARQAYNDSVMSYNTYRQSFPQNFLASFFGHNQDAQLLEFEDKAEIQSAPKVSF